MTLTSLLPVRIADDLRIEVDPSAAGSVLTPREALALGERFIHAGARRQAELRKVNALAGTATGTGRK